MNENYESKFMKTLGKVIYVKKMSNSEGFLIGATIQKCTKERTEKELVIFEDHPELCRLAAEVQVNQILYIEGTLRIYNKKEQIKLSRFFIFPNDFDIKLYTKKNYDNMDSSVFITAIYNLDKQLRAIIQHVIGLGGVNDARYEQFSSSFASCRYHGNYEGGLITHTTNMIRLAQAIEKGVLKIYNINLETFDWKLLHASIVLHDAMKITELKNEYDKCIRRTNVIPHQIKICLDIAKINEIHGFIDDETLNKICCIISATHANNSYDTIEGTLLTLLDGLECALNRWGNMI